MMMNMAIEHLEQWCAGIAALIPDRRIQGRIELSAGVIHRGQDHGIARRGLVPFDGITDADFSDARKGLP